MNPHYTLVICTTLILHKTSRDISLRFERLIDFVPHEGLKLKFTNDDGDTFDAELVNLHYDYEKRQFVDEQEDETLLEELREPDRPECTVTRERAEEYIRYYESFGWAKC